MLGGFALAAAPAHANFNLNSECGNSYAVEIHGTEPELSADSTLHYIAAVGQITFAAQNPSGLGNPCAISRGEMIYNDNDVLTFSGGAASCYLADSLLGGGIPCFDGGSHISGTLTQGFDGGAHLDMVATFGWLNGSPVGPTSLPLHFTMQSSAGSLVVLGNSTPDSGPAPTSPPPGSPVLVITMQKQASPSTVSLPVTGPGDQTGKLVLIGTPPSPLGLTGGGGNGFGASPYTGLSVSLFQGYGSPTADLFSQPVQGSFGSTVSSLQIFTNGEAGGSASFSSNDNVGNTTGATNDDCDTYVTQTGNFADGTGNDAAAIIHPSATCLDAFALASFELGSVLWGSTDTSQFTIVTGLSASTLTSGLLVPAGLMSDAIGVQSAPAGGITNLVYQSITSVNGNTATFPYTSFLSTTPAGCDIQISMPTVITGSGSTLCNLHLDNLALVPTNPVNVVVEGDTFPFSKYAFESCTCNGTSGGSATSTLTLSSIDCPLSTTSYSVTCKN